MLAWAAKAPRVLLEREREEKNLKSLNKILIAIGW